MNPDIALETLVRKVTEEVQKRLNSKSSNQRLQVVILSSQPEPELEAMLGTRFAVSYYREGLSDCDLVLIPEVCVQLLANLANGLSATGREQFVLAMLLKGKKVFAREEGLLYRKYKQTAPSGLYKMYDDYTEIIQKCGISIVNESVLLDGLLQDKWPAAEAAAEKKQEPALSGSPSPEVLNKKVVTEADLKKCYLNQITEIVIAQKSVLTPLAHDYLKAHQMKVHRKM